MVTFMKNSKYVLYEQKYQYNSNQSERNLSSYKF